MNFFVHVSNCKCPGKCGAFTKLRDSKSGEWKREKERNHIIRDNCILILSFLLQFLFPDYEDKNTHRTISSQETSTRTTDKNKLITFSSELTFQSLINRKCSSKFDSIASNFFPHKTSLNQAARMIKINALLIYPHLNSQTCFQVDSFFPSWDSSFLSPDKSDCFEHGLLRNKWQIKSNKHSTGTFEQKKSNKISKHNKNIPLNFMNMKIAFERQEKEEVLFAIRFDFSSLRNKS